MTCQMVNRVAPAPAVDIEKSTNGVDADAPTRAVRPGRLDGHWTYLVTNTGNVPLSGIAVTDNQPGVRLLPGHDARTRRDTTCTATGTGDAGQYANIGTVTATGAGQTVSDTDPSHYFGVPPGIDIEKATNGAGRRLPPGPFIPVGGAVTWTYVVTNTGTRRSTASPSPTAMIGPITCPAALNPLAPGAIVTCTATGTAAAGPVREHGLRHGTRADRTPFQDSDASHYFGERPPWTSRSRPTSRTPTRRRGP